MDNVLITGVCGFIGRHFAKRFIDMGCRVTGVDDRSAGTPFPEHWPEPVKLSATDRAFLLFYEASLREWCESYAPDQFDLVLHCAAVVGGRAKIEGDPLAVAVDLAIDADFFRWLVSTRKRPRKVVYFSSSAVYPVYLQRYDFYCKLAEGFVSHDPRVERYGRPDAIYGFAKLAGEYLAHIAAEKYDLDVAVYRPFSGYGEDQDAAYPLPALVDRVLRRETPLQVWGSGQQVRDWIHVDDVVDAVLGTMAKLWPGEALNLGSGIPTSFMTLTRLVRDLSGHSVEVAPLPDKPEGVAWRVADPHKLSQFFRPKVSLEEGVGRVLQARRKLLTPEPV